MAEFTIPLNLTTPHMRGQRVKDAQWLMAGNNKVSTGLATYKDGAIDGDYGLLSAQATYKTKYWLGYPEKSIDKSFGQTIYGLLTGTIKMTPNNLERRKQRLAAVENSVGSKALAIAIPEIGIKESPFGSNMQKYGVWYRMNGVPWCAIFDSWCFAHSGHDSFRYSYVPTVHYDASHVHNRLCIVRTPRPGDLALYNFSGIRDAHIEFFENWITKGSTFSAVGGNTGSASFNNGGEVARNVRYISQVDAFVRVT